MSIVPDTKTRLSTEARDAIISLGIQRFFETQAARVFYCPVCNGTLAEYGAACCNPDCYANPVATLATDKAVLCDVWEIWFPKEGESGGPRRLLAYANVTKAQAKKLACEMRAMLEGQDGVVVSVCPTEEESPDA